MPTIKAIAVLCREYSQFPSEEPIDSLNKDFEAIDFFKEKQK